MDPSPYESKASKESVTKRFKLVWRVLLISNLTLGAYMFANARKKDVGALDDKGMKTRTVTDEGARTDTVDDNTSPKTEKFDDNKGAKTDKEKTKPIIEPSTPSEFTAADEESIFPTVVIQRVKVARAPIPEDQQRELFKWILEEKRKIKPKDREEKNRIDEEKAILKQFIRAKKIPKFFADDSFDSSLRDWEKYFSE